MKYISMPGRLNHQMRFRTALLAIVAIFAASSHVMAAPPADLVKAELLADVASIKPGQPFTAGVLFHIKSAWHIYWKNPGDSGLATRVTFHLPAGFQVGELQFPVPKRIELPGEIVNYGYEDEVMLFAKITPPKDVSGNVEITADTNWLVCQDACIPGKASLQLSLPVSADAKPANESLFKDYAKKIPIQAEQSPGLLRVANALDLSTGSGATEIVASLKITNIQPPIPESILGLEITIDPPQPDTMSTRFPIKAKVMQGQHVTESTLHVLVGGYNVSVPIVGAAGPAPASSSK